MSRPAAELSLDRLLSTVTESLPLLIALSTCAVALLMVVGFRVADGVGLLPVSGLPVDSAVRRVARNSAIPMAAQLVNRAVDLGFTLIVLRVLGATGAGQYEYAVLVWLYAKTVSDFGLSVLTTREVAVAPDRAGQFLGAGTLLRLAVWASVTPAVAAFTAANLRWYSLSSVSALAIAVLLLSIVPDAYSDSANAVCNAFERMAGPALLTVVKNGIKVILGLLFLTFGWGVMALAVAALLNNVLSAALFAALMRRLGIRPRWTMPVGNARRLLGASWPLLLNNLLAGLFFRADIFVLQPARGAHEVGIYSAPYKFLSLAGMIPTYLTLALFPHFSRLSLSSSAELRQTYAHVTKLLLVVSLGVVFVTEVFATELMRLLAGPAFLPGSAIALRILILFLPLSYVNGLTQYLLIAAGEQRRLIHAFALTFAFNISANLLFTPRYGYPAAAAITVVSELVLLVPFAYRVREVVGLPPMASTFVWPAACAFTMGVGAAIVWSALPANGSVLTALVAFVGLSLYIVALLATNTIGAAEWRIARQLLRR